MRVARRIQLHRSFHSRRQDEQLINIFRRERLDLQPINMRETDCTGGNERSELPDNVIGSVLIIPSVCGGYGIILKHSIDIGQQYSYVGCC